MAIRCHRLWNSKRFHWDPKDRVLSVEASTLQQGRTLPLFGRVYDDACDEGFVILSNKTGREVCFVIDKTDFDNDGDIAGWWLKTAAPKDAALNIRVLVIND